MKLFGWTRSEIDLATDEILRKTLDELKNLGFDDVFLERLEVILNTESDKITLNLDELLRERNGIN